MRLIQVTDDTGVEQWLNPDFILGFKPRVKSELGSIVRFGNGTTLNVVDGIEDLKRRFNDCIR